MAMGMQTYQMSDRREDLLSILKDISPNTDNYLTTNLGTGPKATNTYHEWGVYNTARPTSVTAYAEGADASAVDLATPTRSSNIVVGLNKVVKVTGVARLVDTITGEDDLAFQKREALKRLKADMEFITINGVAASGASGVARGMIGLNGLISTNISARSSGTSFSETELNDIMQESWNAVSSEYVADVLLVPMVIKRRIAGFTTNLTRYISAESKKLQGDIQVYGSQVGKDVAIIPHKDVNAAAGTLTVYAIREELFKHSFLREPMYQELAAAGDYTLGQYLVDFTLESYAERASVKRTGYATTL